MRLIDAELVEEIIAKRSKELFKEKESLLSGALVASIVYLDNCPTVDAVPVVRCKDCKHYVSIYGHRFCDTFCNAEEEPYETNPNDFCSYGEREEG